MPSKPLTAAERSLFWTNVVPFFGLDESFGYDNLPDTVRGYIKAYSGDTPPLVTPDEREVKLQVKDQYGVQVYVPMNKTAAVFAAIAKTKTLTPVNIKYILDLGYEVTYVQQPIPTHILGS